MTKTVSLIALCGIPGSGKTTLSKQLASESDAVLYCFDKRRGAFSPTKSEEAKLQMYKEIAEELKLGNSVVCDDLNTKKLRREQLLSAVSQIDCFKKLVVLDTPLEECLKRNSKRQRRIANEIILNIKRKYEPPTLEEGWDEIVFVTTE